MKELSKDQIKKSAKFLREFLREKHKIDLPHGHALEVASNFCGYNDWNTASALSAEVNNENPVVDKIAAKEKPIATKFQTAGQIIEFLSMFDKKTKVFAKEYKWSEPEIDNHNFGTVTSICSLTYDYEIQNGKELYLELNTETEITDHKIGIGASQAFEKTPAGRSQRRIKYLYMQNSFWNPNVTAKADQKS